MTNKKLILVVALAGAIAFTGATFSKTNLAQANLSARSSDTLEQSRVEPLEGALKEVLEIRARAETLRLEETLPVEEGFSLTGKMVATQATVLSLDGVVFGYSAVLTAPAADLNDRFHHEGIVTLKVYLDHQLNFLPSNQKAVLKY